MRHCGFAHPVCETLPTIDKQCVTRVDALKFKFTTKDWGGDSWVSIDIYSPRSVREARSKGAHIHTAHGVWVAYISGNDIEYAGTPAFIPNVIGKNRLQYDAKHALRQHARMEHDIVDGSL